MTDKNTLLHIYSYAIGSLKIGGFGGLGGHNGSKPLLLLGCGCPLTEIDWAATNKSGGQMFTSNKQIDH